MPVLGLDTATGVASVGIVGAAQCVERVQSVAGSHARALLPLIDAVLADAGMRLAELTRIAISIGPGSFTGLRIGLSVAKGLAVATRLPLVGVPTLEAYAHAVGPTDGAVWPILDARKGEIYAASFRWRGDALHAEMPATAMAPAALIERLSAPCTLVGDAVDAHASLWDALPPGVRRLRLSQRPPSGVVVAQLGQTREPTALAALEPAYCRAAEAEMHRERRAAALSIG
ncbi:MAG: tRNA (adenosine(37)-N6)-threonylcarbamoyltransferase complex dimerization subunit type 1 TsaB [Deltaproteobacteria bacterium]|nr:tRNA (adenosine(37)-N6)-threonylcarbamoyltransferase complex dimerization subunit type 1 TsaB [Deltaproteobacteria bacterium]